LIYLGVLALALGAAFYWLLDEGDRPFQPESIILLCAFAYYVLDWAKPPLVALGPALAPELSRGAAFWLALPCVLFGPIAFASVRRTWKLAALGLAAAVLLCGEAFWAHRWIAIAQAYSALGRPFAAGALNVLRPLMLAVSAGLTLFILVHEEFSGRRFSWLMGLLILWGAPTWLMELRLKALDFGPRSLAQAAGLQVEPPPDLGVLDLGGVDAEGSTVRVFSGPIALTPTSIAAMDEYLRAREGRTIFAKQASDAVRHGLLAWWEADLALEAHAAAMGQIRPDYRQALALLRAGPLTRERYEALEKLEALAQKSPQGFESILQSQFIFEAFSAAFGRFGDSAKAREWLGKIDRLWPVYEKKIEASPVESMRDGEISGTLLLEGRPARALKVGLFYLASSTATYRDGSNLCCSAFPDGEGRFRFQDLGAGRYKIALLGGPELARARVQGVPGVVALDLKARTEELAPILIEQGENVYNNPGDPPSALAVPPPPARPAQKAPGRRGS
jgi:hypothetical protein